MELQFTAVFRRVPEGYIAFVEELIWDRAVWHDRAWLFGESWNVGALKLLIVSFFALP